MRGDMVHVMGKSSFFVDVFFANVIGILRCVWYVLQKISAQKYDRPMLGSIAFPPPNQSWKANPYLFDTEASWKATRITVCDRGSHHANEHARVRMHVCLIV